MESIEPAPAKRTRKNRDDVYMTDNEGSDVDPKMERIMSVLLVVAAIVVALVAVFVVGRAFGLFSATPSGKLAEGMVETPEVVGLSLEEASTVLREAGLTAKASYKESTQYDKDIISEQTPPAGEAIEEGGVLELVVSSGKVEAPEEGSEAAADVKMVKVPDVKGLLKAEARVMLENEEFTVLEEETEDEDYYYHRLLERVYRQIHAGGYPQPEAPADILSVLLNADEVHTELPFSYRDGEDIWNGTIDALYRRDGQWHIIDFKTDYEFKTHRTQLNAYIEAFRQLTGESADALIYHIPI